MKCFYCDREAVGIDNLSVPTCTLDANESYMRHWSCPELQTMVDSLFPKESDE